MSMIITLIDCGNCGGSGNITALGITDPCPECDGRGTIEVTDGQVDGFPLLDRSAYIGSSDAPQIAGVSSYGSPLSVWMRKVGLAEEEPSSLRMWLGVRLEPIVLELYEARTGLRPDRVVGPDDPPLLSAEHPYIGAHPDYERLEIKTSRSGFGYGEDGATVTVDEMAIPLPHFIQAQHQLYVTGWDSIDLAVLIGHDAFRTFTIPANPDVIAALVLAEVEFWGFVTDFTPPPDEDPESRRAYLRKRFPRPLLDARPATPEEVALLDEWRIAKAAAVEAKDLEDRLGNRLRESIGEAAGLTGQVSYTSYTRRDLDRKVVEAELRAIGRGDIITAALRASEVRTLRDVRKEDS